MAKARPVTPTPETAEDNLPELADIAEVFGEKLEAIEGQRVVVTRVDFTTREVAEDPSDPDSPTVVKSVAIIHARPLGHPDVDPDRFYTFSAPLINKLRDIGPRLPARATFERIPFDGGRKQVWSIR